MNGLSPRPRPVVIVIALLAGALLAGCSSSKPTASIAPIATSSFPAELSPGPSDQASDLPDSPEPSVGPSVEQTPIVGFTTPVPPSATTPWTTITWRQLDPGDPLGQVRSVTRWRGGLIAVGAATPSAASARTPVWVSPDGATWTPLDPAVFGLTTLVLGVEPTPTGVVAITVQGGVNDCGDESEPLFCWTPGLPLQSWTSSDGSTWAAHPGPDIQLTPDCQDCGIDLPLIAVGKPGILLVGRPTTGLQLALTTDGITWQVLPGSSFPNEFFPNDVAGYGDGFLAVGQTTDDPGRAVAFSSTDGRTWQSHALASTAADAQTDTSADLLVVGPAGVIAKGGTGAAPGLSLWWSTLDGSAWNEVANYPPLGVWTGAGEGTGLMEDGNLVGDGERMLAYRGGDKEGAWTSTDGRNWKAMQIDGPGAALSGDDPSIDLTIMPLGVVWLADDGTTWFGEPGG
jgi:hypothetical protein